MSIKKLFCDNWEFAKTRIGTNYSDELAFERVDIPHDWLIFDTRNLYETGTGWYRRTYVHNEDGLRTYLGFDGVYMDSEVFVNGRSAGEWKYGYTSFEFDITDALREGENLICVRVNFEHMNSRWYSGAGIFRPVYLIKRDNAHIVSDGIYISAGADGDIKISVESARLKNSAVADYELRLSVFDKKELLYSITNPVCAVDDRFIVDVVRREGFSYGINNQTIHIEKPRLWDVDDPYLYSLKAELIKAGVVCDEETVRLGFRDIEFTTDNGFFLNNRALKLHGACEHHDLGALGAAVNKVAIVRKMKMLKSMGINAIRTSHNPPSREWMEAADELGILIMSEGFDMWEMPKNPYDYARFFKEWIDRDVASWVRRDRNHPSVIGWSVGNEIYDCHASERGQEIISELLYLVKLHDPRGNGYVTHGSNFLQWENAQKCTDIVKLAGYNYAERLYEEHHKKHPDWMIYGSETSSVVQSRGIYHFPYNQAVLVDDDEQCSSLGNSTMGWAAKSTEMAIIPDRDTPFCAGQFIWTGFDYIGEPTPYATKNSYFGQIDTAGFVKDSYYIFKAEWTDYKKAPFVHILPYWDFSEGQEIDVRVISNCDKVRLYFDEECVGEKIIDHAHGMELSLNVTLPYRRGTLRAFAYDAEDNELASDMKTSFTDAKEIILRPDKETLLADGRDLIFLEIAALDINGVEVANANNRINVSVTGAGRLVGLDNGDSTDYEQYKGTSKRLFSGKLMALIASKEEPGEIEVKVSSPGLGEKTLKLLAKECEKVSGVSCLTENKAYDNKFDTQNEIPVRKIEFVCADRKFKQGEDVKRIAYRIYPENATHTDIIFKVTTVLGIETNLAQITEINDKEITVKCKGDGEFYLRAMCKNGTDKNQALTQIGFSAEGLGSASFNPYKMVIGGLFNVSKGGVSTGVERGACFGGDESYFGFTDVDFGMVGSNKINLPIYHLGNDPVSFRVYDGIPGEGGECIGEYSYWKPPIWQTYQAEDYVLGKTLKGVHTLVFEAKGGFQIAGFTFYETPKETALICASNALKIYGDSFNVGEDEVTGIGNNVVLDFGEFDFAEKTPVRLVICGRSELKNNSIHVDFKGDATVKALCEFAMATEYTEREFELGDVTGHENVTFTFLPGSNFDFKYFKFIYN